VFQHASLVGWQGLVMMDVIYDRLNEHSKIVPLIAGVVKVRETA
jgi:hypothetical protein